MKKYNNFVPDYFIKYQAKQLKRSTELIIVEDQSTKKHFEKSNEHISERPNLSNAHCIKGEQRRALDYLIKENIKLYINSNKRKHGEYFILVFGTDRQTNQVFTISIGTQGKDKLKKIKLRRFSDKPDRPKWKN